MKAGRWWEEMGRRRYRGCWQTWTMVFHSGCHQGQVQTQRQSHSYFVQLGILLSKRTREVYMYCLVQCVTQNSGRLVYISITRDFTIQLSILQKVRTRSVCQLFVSALTSSLASLASNSSDRRFRGKVFPSPILGKDLKWASRGNGKSMAYEDPPYQSR